MKDVEPGGLDFLQGPWPMRGSLYRYMEPQYAAPYVDGGSIRISRAASYIGSETRGIMTPDEVKHKVGYGFPAGIDGEPFAGGFGYVFAENLTLGNVHIAFAAEYNWTVNHMVLCFSNSASHRVRVVLDKPANAVVLRIVQPDILIDAISDALGCRPIYGEVKYTDSPDRGAFTKGLDSAEQREVRLAWDYKGPEDELHIAIPPGVGEIVNTDERHELIDPRIIRTGGVFLQDFVMQGTHLAQISAMMSGDEEWLSEFNACPTKLR